MMGAGFRDIKYEYRRCRPRNLTSRPRDRQRIPQVTVGGSIHPVSAQRIWSLYLSRPRMRTVEQDNHCLRFEDHQDDDYTDISVPTLL
jgi:hypothetical protein